MFDLVFLSGPRAGESFPVRGSFVSGRSPDCPLELPDPNASRQHARFVFDGTHLTVSDNRSANGTFVNDARIATPTILRVNDVVRMGETRLKVVVRGGGVPVDPSQSSIFAFAKEDPSELSNSLVMSMAEAQARVTDPAALRARLDAIMTVSEKIVRIDRIEEVLGGILDALLAVFPQAERVFLMVGSDPQLLTPRAIRERRPGAETPTASRSLCAQALARRGGVLWQQGGADFAAGLSLVGLSIRHAMAAALVVGNDALGVIQIDTTDAKRAFTQDDLSLALAVARQAAGALNNAFLLQKTERDAAMRNNLLRFLPGPLAEQASSGSIDVGLGGRGYQGTVLFSDMIGFTRMSEGLAPERVIQLMNGYFDRMVRAIQQEGGAIDKFIGDAIMAFWGIPAERPGAEAHATHAVAAALSMQTLLAGLNSDRAASGESALAHGIGINTGPVVAGNVGSQSSTLSYTLLGDTVNTASRIEHHALASQVLAAHSTWSACGGAYGLRLPSLSVRNKAEALTVYSVRGLRAGGEIVLHLPVRLGESGLHGVLVRRLADLSFVLLAPKGATGSTLASAAPEWPGAPLGAATVLETLPAQSTDGSLLRLRVALADKSLAGLLGDQPITCALGWDQLIR